MRIGLVNVPRPSQNASDRLGRLTHLASETVHPFRIEFSKAKTASASALEFFFPARSSGVMSKTVLGRKLF